MNRAVPATRQSGTSRLEVEAEQLDDQRRADIGAEHGEQAGRAADDARPGEGADDERDRGGALQADGQGRPGADGKQRIAQDGAQPVAQHVAIGALDACAHHARGKQQQRDRAGKMQQDERAAHGRAAGRPASAGAQSVRGDAVVWCESGSWRSVLD